MKIIKELIKSSIYNKEYIKIKNKDLAKFVTVINMNNIHIDLFVTSNTLGAIRTNRVNLSVILPKSSPKANRKLTLYVGAKSGNFHLITDAFNDNIFIGDEVSTFDCFLNLFGGCNVYIGDQSTSFTLKIQGQNSDIIIGKDTMISDNVRIQAAQMHPIIDTKTGEVLQQNSDPTIIEDHVWVGLNSTVLPGVKVSEGSIVGACSVVNKSIPKNCICAGVPAKVIKENKTWSREWGKLDEYVQKYITDKTASSLNKVSPYKSED